MIGGYEQRNLPTHRTNYYDAPNRPLEDRSFRLCKGRDRPTPVNSAYSAIGRGWPIR
jgi:hypothetical protein